jgi:hypothetical protein
MRVRYASGRTPEFLRRRELAKRGRHLEQFRKD